MPFQPFRYSNIPIQRHDPSELVQALMQGYQASQMPQRREEEKDTSSLKQDLLRSQIMKAMQPQEQKPMSSIGKLRADRDAAEKSGASPEQLKQYDDALANASQGRQGITVIDPKTGQEMVRIGGPAGSQRGSEGNVFQTKDEQVSPVSRTTKSAIEKSLIASKQVDNLASNFKEIGKTKGAWNKALNLFQKFSNEYLGGDYNTPSELAYVRSSMKSAVEPLIREMGLNATDKTINEVKGIIEPQMGESASGYRERITKQLEDFAVNNKGKSDILFEGVRREVPKQSNEGGMVKILSPYGGLHLVPQDQVEEALKRGGKRA